MNRERSFLFRISSPRPQFDRLRGQGVLCSTFPHCIPLENSDVLVQMSNSNVTNGRSLSVALISLCGISRGNSSKWLFAKSICKHVLLYPVYYKPSLTVLKRHSLLVQPTFLANRMKISLSV